MTASHPIYTNRCPIPVHQTATTYTNELEVMTDVTQPRMPLSQIPTHISFL